MSVAKKPLNTRNMSAKDKCVDANNKRPVIDQNKSLGDAWPEAALITVTGICVSAFTLSGGV